MLFSLLFLAHIIGDFFLQTDDFCKKKKFGAKQLFWHSFAIFALSFFALIIKDLSIYSLLLALLIGSVHYLIDGLKRIIDSKCSQYKLYSFSLDQFFHIAVIYAISRYCYDDTFNDIPKVLIIANALLVCAKPSNIFVKLILEKYKLTLENSKDGNSALSKAGELIGTLERVISLISIITGQVEIVGFLIAAKSILRYKDSETAKTEYVLVGTLLSLVIVFAVGLSTKSYFESYC